MNEYQNCKVIAIPKSKMDYRSYAFAFQKHSPYLPIMNYYINRIRSLGVFNKKFKKYQPYPQVCEDASGKPLNLDNCISAFLALGQYYILSLPPLSYQYTLLFC